MPRPITLAGVAVLLAVSPASAQAPPPGQAGEITVKARPSLVVTGQTCPPPDPARHPAERDPVVVDSFPRQGAQVAPGALRVRVSFDQPMSCFSEVMVDGGPGDPCEPDGSWTLPDRESWSMVCRFPPGTPVRISFRRIDGQGFVGLSGRRAAPYVLDFETSEGPPASLAEAAAADPGPPGEGRPYAEVTCTGRAGAAPGGRDCRRDTLGAAPP
jgi:hypothetical protein